MSICCTAGQGLGTSTALKGYQGHMLPDLPLHDSLTTRLAGQMQQGLPADAATTCRWMAPEVIEHNPYREKADVFSFGITLWELLTAKVPYSEMSPLQVRPCSRI